MSENQTDQPAEPNPPEKRKLLKIFRKLEADVTGYPDLFSFDRIFGNENHSSRAKNFFTPFYLGGNNDCLVTWGKICFRTASPDEMPDVGTIRRAMAYVRDRWGRDGIYANGNIRFKQASWAIALINNVSVKNYQLKHEDKRNLTEKLVIAKEILGSHYMINTSQFTLPHTFSPAPDRAMHKGDKKYLELVV